MVAVAVGRPLYQAAMGRTDRDRPAIGPHALGRAAGHHQRQGRRTAALRSLLGTPNIGGPIATKGGVLFIAATMDGYLRAIEMATGKELWRDALPGGSQTTPMSYMAGGRQFVVVASGQ